MLTGIQPYFKHDTNHDLLLDPTELSAAFSSQDAIGEIWIKRLPELMDFYAAHGQDFHTMWTSADRDGNLEATDLDELLDFWTQSNTLAFKHFFLHHQ